jgi:hypothetical protein
MKWCPNLRHSAGRLLAPAFSRGQRAAFALGCSSGLLLAFAAALVAGSTTRDLASGLTGLMTPLIAIIGAYVAFQQWKTNHQKLQLDLYARRLVIYDQVRGILGIIARDADVTPQEMIAFGRATTEAAFLFGDEVSTYINEIYRRGMTLSAYHNAHNQAAAVRAQEFDYVRVAELMNAELTWLLAQFEPATKMFAVYLRMK